jgi:hypothetical protein
MFMKLRMPDEVLEVGDAAAHGEVVYPEESLIGVGATVPAAVPAGAAREGEPIGHSDG